MIKIKAAEGQVDIKMSGRSRDVTAEMILIIKDLTEAFAEHTKSSFADALQTLSVGAVMVNNNPECLIKSETKSEEL